MYIARDFAKKELAAPKPHFAHADLVLVCVLAAIGLLLSLFAAIYAPESAALLAAAWSS